ncbi:MAG: hypothetical protein WAV50_03080 [Minisyncoccia bacterium]
MRYKTFAFLLALSVLTASCASHPGLHTDVRTSSKQCSETQSGAIRTFIQGIGEFNLALLKAVTPDGTSLYEIFGNNDIKKGRELVRELSAHPEVSGADGSCTCSLLSFVDTVDPEEKIATVQRAVMVGDDLRNYTRAFRVRFDPQGNCILSISPLDSKWKRL